MKLLIFAYIVTGLYSLGLLWSLLKGLKKHNLPGAYDNLSLRKYAFLLVLVALVVTPVDFWITLSHKIPNENYIIDLTVKCDNGTTFNGKGTVLFSEDVEYYDSGHDGEPLFGISSGDKKIVYRNFYLTYVDCDDKYEVWIDDSEPIEGTNVKATVYFNTDSEYSEVDAEIILPELTDKTLGITLNDKLEAYSISGYIEHALVFISALIDIILCFMAVSQREKSSKTI